MARAYSLLSWNVEHFGKKKGAAFKNHLNRVCDIIKAENPDVFSIYEVEGKEVFDAVTRAFHGYSFHITEGPQMQEILVAVRGSTTAFFTQKLTFKSGIQLLRPGALLTLIIDGKNYPILFLHLKSANDPRSFGLRDDMLSKSIKFMKRLKRNHKNANYLFIGDLNTMGMNYYWDRDISADVELKKSDTYAARYYDMQRIDKTHQNTWSNGSKSTFPPSALDHCYAADHLNFKEFNNKDRSGKSPVDVRGWVDQSTTAARDKWISDYSDHSYLYLEVEKI